ncbi:transglutaminase domain-containing protein [Pelagicoccus albus]|uniref:DUF3857 domain-containing protein n=1 Tax=Pelagicoccus albus TaxID=415222 RepID=A0A7X1EAB5_9BACT|nr:DUF3857 domain-containing protein [Pelagicoccus albus]MBC2608103.1 DUF3857 domain-containing protein [Pelagicoccus albus]
MKHPYPLGFRARVRAGFALMSALILFGSLQAIENWREIPPEDFAVKASSIDPEASVEILFAEHKASQELISNTDITAGIMTMERSLVGNRTVYVRMKVFNELGVDLLSKHAIRPMHGEKVVDVAARTVKPDGTSYELDEADVHKLLVEETEDESQKAETFAFPSLAAGDIVEYQATFDIDDVGGVFTRFSDRFPARRVTVRIKPTDAISHRVISFGFPLDKLNQKDGDYYLYEMTDVRAELDEKYAVPPMQAEPHVVMFYVKEYFPDPDDFWDDFSSELASYAKKDFKPSKTIKAKAAELTAGAKDDSEKLRRILKFCTEEITNFVWDFTKYSETERKELKDNKSPSDTLKNGYGKPRHIRALFGALATAAGFEARYVAIGNRDEFFFSKEVSVKQVVDERLIAIKDGESWLYFDPGNPALRFGELSWKHAGSQCMMGDFRDPIFAVTPGIKSEDAVVQTKADLEISEEGTLSGKVTKTYIGQKAWVKRDQYRKMTFGEIEEDVSDTELRHYSNVTVENVSMKNRSDEDLPFVISYDLKIENYADVIGDRLVIAPALFQKELSLPFVKEERLSDIVFDCPWRDVDRIEIVMPEGYQFEAGDAPVPFALGDVVLFDSKIRINKKKNSLVLQREFRVNQEIIPSKAYALLKSAFETMKIEDNKSITVKKADS